MALNGTIPTRAVGAPSNRLTVGAYLAGSAATVAGLAYAALDHAVLGGLDRHLHALYDSVGKYGETGPIYGFLYVTGVLGLLLWWSNLRLVRRSSPAARRWGAITLAVATLPVFAPLAMQEYGQMVIPLGLAAGYLAAWVCGLIGVSAVRHPRDA